MLVAALQYRLNTYLPVQSHQGKPNRSAQICWSNQGLTSIDSPAPWTWEENYIWIIWDAATQLKNNIYACRRVCSWERSLCMVRGVPCYSMDTWTGGWHSLFLALVGQLIHLLCLAGFTISNPRFLGRPRIQEAKNYIGAMLKGSKTKHQHEHGRFWFQSTLPGTSTVLQASTFCKRILSFAVLGFDVKKVNTRSMKTFQFSKSKPPSCYRRELNFFFLIEKRVPVKNTKKKKVFFYCSFIWPHYPCELQSFCSAGALTAGSSATGSNFPSWTFCRKMLRFG